MIREIALEPDLLNSLERLRYFMGKFGFDQGRVVSKLPSKWMNNVYAVVEKAALRPVDKTRVVSLLRDKFDKRALVPRPGHNWTHGKSWLDNVLAEHGRKSLDAIIAHVNPKSSPCVTLGDEVDDWHPCMLSECVVEVERKAESMTAPIRSVLSCAREIIFVDAYFNGNTQKSRSVGHFNPLLAFLSAIWHPQRNSAVRRVEYHTEIADVRELAILKNRCEAVLPAYIPTGSEMVIVGWKERELHDRYILTDLCAFDFGIGLDEGDSDDPRKLMIKILPDRRMHQTLLSRFCEANGHLSFKVEGAENAVGPAFNCR